MDDMKTYNPTDSVSFTYLLSVSSVTLLDEKRMFSF